MQTMAARVAKNHFGELLDTAQREPVAISKKGRDVVVVLSQEEYARMQAALNAAENAYWAHRADWALEHAEWIGPEASEAFLKELLENAKA